MEYLEWVGKVEHLEQGRGTMEHLEQVGKGVGRTMEYLERVNEIYHDESLGVHINVVLVRMMMLAYTKVSKPGEGLTCLLRTNRYYGSNVPSSETTWEHPGTLKLHHENLQAK
ncbi:A disintegrin and metalloproteinase with thrombospondin motifs 3, partial [Ophiophagus hannah]